MDSNFCRMRAAADRKMADESPLAMEKSKYLSSAKKWEQMADIAERAEAEHILRIEATRQRIAERDRLLAEEECLT